MGAIPVGGVLQVVARNPAAKADLPALARLLGHRALSAQTTPEGTTVITVRRAH
ncbi:MAG TPA: hypothetical protein HA326_08105 [Thermoplasmata archaeon]|nr:hypothetical protein [Thermoplasmata archaeon]